MDQQEQKVSIIVPVYKVEKYLQKCLDSIAAQTYRNIEVILVDDGSPDRCGEMCEAFAATNHYTKVLHQANQGLSAARNNGVLQSTGEYITFIDSDDYVTPDYVEYLLTLLKRYNAEIAAGARIYQYEGKEEAIPREETRSGFYTVEESLTKMNYGIGFSVFAWGKLYKRELVTANPYPVGALYEDLATTYRIVADSTGVASGNKQIYYWLQRSGSIMHSEFNEKQMDGLEAAQRQIDFFREKYPSAVQAGKARYEAKIIEIMAIALKSKDSHAWYLKVKNKSRYMKEVLADRNVKRSQKIRMISIRLGYLPTKIVYHIHEKLKRNLI